jgi:N-formylglutamate deformylase
MITKFGLTEEELNEYRTLMQIPEDIEDESIDRRINILKRLSKRRLLERNSKAMQKIILHVPHSSDKIPFFEGYTVDKETLEKEIVKLTDWYTDDLFFFENAEIIRADFSRIFCDPERFTDDTQEIMAQYGMGVLYEKTDDGNQIRTVNAALRKDILENYYWKHHKNLSNAVTNQLNIFGKALIIDCHSYPSIPLVRDLDKNNNRPDFNIGTDAFHTPKYLIEAAEKFFKNEGYSLGIDWPYKGAIVPLEHYGTNKNVQSIMLEVNRKLYLDEPTNNKSKQYNDIKIIVHKFLETMKDCFVEFDN